MPTFKYRAYNDTGKAVSGDIEAAGSRDAAERLKKGGLYPIDVTEAGLPRTGLVKRGVAAEQLALTTRQLSTLLATGTNLSDALEVLAENTTNAVLKPIVLRVRERVMEGGTLSRALESYPEVFSPFFRGLVASGEAGGSLDKSLARLADYLETRSKIVRDLKTALVYPALMSVVGAGVLVFLLIFVIPKITRIFEDTDATLPLITVVLIWLAGLVSRYWPLIPAVIAGGVLAYNRLRGSRWLKAFLDVAVLKAPWFGDIAASFYVASMTRTLGSLLKGGVGLLTALEITKTAVNNSVYGHILEMAASDCTGGGSLSASLKRHPEVPPIVAHMASVGEKGGNLDDMLLRASEAYEEEFGTGLKRTIALVEPLMILAMGVVIGTIVLAILLPIFELNQIVR